MDAAIASFAVEKLGNFIISEVKSLLGVEDQVRQLRTELTRIACFLKDVERKEGDERRVINCIIEIRNVAYDAEDVIETYILKVASRRRGGGPDVLQRCARILSEGFTLRKLGSEIKVINIKISDITRSLSTYGISLTQEGHGSSSKYDWQKELRWAYSHVEEENVVEMDKEVEVLVAQLVSSEKHVVIWGMGGLGKTTLPKRIYRARRHFNYAWNCISQKWEPKDVLYGLLIELKSSIKEEREEIDRMRIEQLAKHLCEFQKERECLIILDDIWSTLDSISAAFPKT